MARKVKLPASPKTSPKNIRFPNDVIAQAEEAIQGAGISFSAFVIEATCVALENLKEEED